MAMLVSIIVPVYNAAAFLRRCVQSIAGQTHRELEIILVDDGSSDATPELCIALAEEDSRIRYVRQENKGVSAARNTGLDLACGEYLQFVDADDTLEPEATARLLEAVSRADADFAMAGHWRVTYNTSSVLSEKPQKMGRSGVFNRSDFFRRFADGGYLVYLGWEYCWDKIYSRAFLTNNQVTFPVGMRLCEDRMFMLQCLRHCRTAVVIPDLLYRHYLPAQRDIHASASTVFEHSRWQAHQHSFDMLFSLIKEHGCWSDDVAAGIYKDYVNTMVVVLYRYCRADSTADRYNRLRHIREITEHPMMRDAIRTYKPGSPAENKIMPFLLRWSCSRLLAVYAAYKARKIYG